MTRFKQIFKIKYTMFQVLWILTQMEMEAKQHMNLVQQVIVIIHQIAKDKSKNLF